MSHFTARVQLPGHPSPEQYNRLHLSMQSLGLLLITDRIGPAHYMLPHGFYAGRSNLQMASLGDAIKLRADAIVAGAEVVVTEGNMYFDGLRRVAVKSANSR